MQSLYRVCRLGQKKHVYVYRLITSGTMENVIYNRQIAKQSTSERVIDDQKFENQFTKEQLGNLFAFNNPPPGQTIDNENLVARDLFLKQVTQARPNAVVELVSHNSYFEEDLVLPLEIFEEPEPLDEPLVEPTDEFMDVDE
uniref:Uncharacterized protein n=1 Tax=Panagrolaimus davidi TaxID=227884 RepID=A0A914PR71_9BILA